LPSLLTFGKEFSGVYQAVIFAFLNENFMDGFHGFFVHL
jgi:hypothetical protein